MRSIWHSLAWKEWHEHKWKLAALLAILCGTNLLFVGIHPQEFFSGSYWITVLSIVPLAIFFGAYTATGERSRSTVSFLDSLPVPSWKPAICKLLAGVLGLVAVVVLTTCFAFLLAICFGLRIPGARVDADPLRQLMLPPVYVVNWFFNTTLTLSAVAVSVFLWTIAAGVNRTDEVSAGARAVLTIVIWWTLLALIGNQTDQKWFTGSGRPVVATLVEVSPAGAAVMFPKNQTAAEWAGTRLPVILGLAAHLGLAGLFVWRFGRPAREWNFGRTIEQPVAPAAYWPRPPWRSQLGAIAWKQARESGPILAAGLAGILGVTALIICANAKEFLNKPVEATQVYATVTSAFSYFIAIVIGIGVSLNDLSPKVNTFWRSRPIDPDRWYWTKLATGVSVLLVTLFLPVVILMAIGHQFDYDKVWSGGPNDAAWIIVGVVTATFFTAVTMMVLLRHAVYAAIFTIALMYLSYCTVVGTLGLFRWLLWDLPLRTVFEMSPGDPAVAVGLVATTVLVVIIGWLATRYDWGRQSRY